MAIDFHTNTQDIPYHKYQLFSMKIPVDMRLIGLCLSSFQWAFFRHFVALLLPVLTAILQAPPLPFFPREVVLRTS